MLDRVPADCRDGVLQVQRAIIQLSQSFCLSDKNNNDILTAVYSQHRIDELTTVSQFLAGTDNYQSNRLILHGLFIFAEDLQRRQSQPHQNFMLRFIEEVGTNGTFGSFIEKAAIIQFTYSSDSESIESTFLKRWIQTDATADNTKVAVVYDLTKQQKNNTNRFWCRVDDIWTPEEKRYVEIIGWEATAQLLQNETSVQYLRLLQKATAQQIKEQLIQFSRSGTELTEEQMKQFHERFDRSHNSAREDGLELKWIVWLNDVVLKSLKSTSRFDITSVGQLLAVSEDHSFEQLLHTTLSSRPHLWLDDLLVSSVIEAIYTIFEDRTLETGEWDLRIFIKRFQGPARKLLYVLRDQLEDESERQLQRNEKDLESFKQLLASLQNLHEVPDNFIFRLKRLPLSRWPKRVRHLQLSQKWSKSLANRLTKLDIRLGPQKTDQFLDKFVELHPSDTAEYKKKKLDAILKHLFKYTWLFEELELMMSTPEKEEQDRLWQLVENEQAIIDEMTSAGSCRDLKDTEIIRILATNENGNQLDQKLLLDQMKTIKRQRESASIQVNKWITDVKEGKTTADIVTFLSVACIVVKKMENYYPRDTQLVAVLILAGSSNHKISCMAEIATGEGKTLITAMFAIYLSLSGRKDGTGCVNVVTSSPVLAEENVAAVANLFHQFGISVGNNCDQDCSDDEDKRRERYKNDVIYGDLSSFQRDELISRFFGRDVTRNRKADAVIVDEVVNSLNLHLYFIE